MSQYGPTPYVATPQPLYARYKHGPNTIKFIPDPTVNYGAGTGAGVPFGGVVVVGSIVGIANVPLAANVEGALVVLGVFDFPVANGDVSLTSGVDAFWNATTNVATSDASAGTYLGKVEPPGVANGIVSISINTIANAGGVEDVTTTVTAAGTNQGTAAALKPGLNLVSGASGTTGVILPASGPVTVFNTNASHALLVYPPTGATINAGSANADLSMAESTSATFFQDNAGNWHTVPTVPS